MLLVAASGLFMLAFGFCDLARMLGKLASRDDVEFVLAVSSIHGLRRWRAWHLSALYRLIRTPFFQTK